MSPRARKSPKSKVAATDPTPLAEILTHSPIAQALVDHEAKSRIEHPVPDTDGSEAALSFKRQREREQAVTEPPPERPVRQQKSWGETVRGWTSHGSTGVKHVTTTSPDMVGISFPKDKPRTDEEKREMEDAGMRFFRDAQAWLKTNRDGAFDQTQDLARKFAERRRQAEVEVQR